MQIKFRRLIYFSFIVFFYLLYISGLYILWSDNELGLFMNYIFAVFGLRGILYFHMMFYEKFIENYK
jgi:hypothetical protein